MPSAEEKNSRSPAPAPQKRGDPYPAYLLLLAFIPAFLLLYTMGEFHRTSLITADINHAASLRYRSLRLYGATNAGITAVKAGGTPEAVQGAFTQMANVRADLQRRYPEAVAEMEPSWNALRTMLEREGKVDWATADRFCTSADELTQALDEDLRAAHERVGLLFSVSVTALVLLLPWGYTVSRRLQTARAESEQQATELALASARFQELFQGVPAACFTYDMQGCIVEWNRAAQRLFGYAAEEVAGRPLWETLSRPERREASRELVQEVLDGVALPEIEWLYADRSGNLRNILSAVFPLRGANGHVTGGISLSIDFTARREAEDRIRDLLTDVATSEERLRSVAERAQCLLWEAFVTEVPRPADSETEVAAFDPVADTVLAWDFHLVGGGEHARSWLPIDWDSAENVTAAWGNSHFKEDTPTMLKTAIDALRQGQSQYEQEFRVRLLDGSLRWLHEGVQIERLEVGHWRLIGVCTDVTERRATEARLLGLTAELERSNAALEEFAYIASHDLKEPLRKIQTFSTLLVRRAEERSLGEQERNYIARMSSAAERMQALIDGLLNYGRAARKPRQAVPIDLNVVITEVLTDLEARIAETGGQVSVEPLPPVLAESLQMRQLFQNLISNALKYHKPEEPACVTIRVADNAGETPPGFVCLTVSDQGIGFDPRYKERIFAMFEQIEPTDNRRDGNGGGDKGTGVGLAICRKILERCGGSITADSVPGEGTTFTLILPRAPLPMAAAPDAASDTAQTTANRD